MTLDGSLEIVSNALDAHAARLKIHANNIANIDTPFYVRKIPILTENTAQSFDDILANMRDGVMHAGIVSHSAGVILSGVATDPTPGRRVYMPQHPQADAEGYIMLSNVNVLTDMADATLSSRLYEANLSVAGIIKAMQTKALEVGR
jgi:flagellar basal-body rod protein FlgC